MDVCKKPGFDIFKITTLNPLEHPVFWGEVFSGVHDCNIEDRDIWSENEKVSLGQMLHFSFSDLVSIFNIASVNPEVRSYIAKN